MVQELADRAGLPHPRVYVMHESQPNAFATGRNPARSAVAVTTGLMQILSREELAGVIAHELAHIRNRDTLTMTVAATIAGGDLLDRQPRPDVRRRARPAQHRCDTAARPRRSPRCGR